MGNQQDVEFTFYRNSAVRDQEKGDDYLAINTLGEKHRHMALALYSGGRMNQQCFNTDFCFQKKLMK